MRVFQKKIEPAFYGISNILIGVLLAISFASIGYTALQNGNRVLAITLFAISFIEIVSMPSFGIYRLVARKKRDYIKITESELFIGVNKIKIEDISKMYLPQIELGDRVNNRYILVETKKQKKFKVYINQFDNNVFKELLNELQKINEGLM